MGRVEETNEVTRAIEEGTISNFKKAYWAKTSHEMSGAIQIEIAKSLAQLADDIHFLRETTAKEKEEVEKRSNLTCADCQYSYVIDHIDRGLLTRFNVEFCSHRGKEVSLRYTPICDHFKQKEKEAEL